MTDSLPVPAPIEELVLAQRAHLDRLAKAWLAAGASAVGVSHETEILAIWPEETPRTGPSSPEITLRAPLNGQMGPLADLWIAGLAGEAAAQRLEAEAEMIAHLFAVEGEMMDMTIDLINSQDQLIALFGLTDSLRSQLRLDQSLDRVVEEARRLLSTEAAFMVFSQPDVPPLVVQLADPALDEGCLLGLFEKAREVKTPIQINKADLPGRIGKRANNLYLLPIHVRGEIMAVLGLINKMGGSFKSPDQKLAKAIANQVGAQLENVLLHQETLAQARLQTEMDLAKTVQLRLLPQKAPQIPGLDLVGSSQPALEVGGDFFDYIHEPGRPLTCLVGDVSGKGMPAAMLMTMTLTAFRSKAHEIVEPAPEQLISRTNEALYNDFTDVGMFATVFLGQFNEKTREYLYVNAGHSPVIYRPAEGSARMLEADGVPLGVLPISLCEEQRVRMGPGDLLIVGSDGFSEAANGSGEMFGYDRLLHLADQLADASAQQIHDHFYARIREFGAGHQQDDDQTLMVLKGIE